MTQHALRKPGALPHRVPAAHAADRGHAVAGRGRLRRFVAEHLLLLPVGAAAALIWANGWPESYFRFTYAIRFAVNDVGMAFFFGLIAKEVVEATAPGGVLHPWRRAALPLAAAFGSVLVPQALLALFSRVLDEPMLSVAWLVPGAVDLALCYVVVRLIFRPTHPAVPFLLLLGIASNAIAIAALAVLYPARTPQPFVGAGLMLAAILSTLMMRRLRLRSFWPYILAGGALSWLALYVAGTHPALALVPIVALMPHARRDPGFFAEASPRAHDPLNEFERWWTWPVHVVLFFFALVNTGVHFRALEWGAVALPLASIAGRPVGLLIGVAMALAIGLHLPSRLGWRELVVVGFISSLGFTFALFLGTAILGAGQLLSEIRIGVLLTLPAGLLALWLARRFRIGRFEAG
jgi:NhaA family Na+:H+ antiporter